MAKLDEQKKLLVMETLKERKDILDKNLRIFLDRKDLSNKEARILKAVLLESIAETKEAITELKSTGNYGACFKCKKDMPLLDLEENSARQTCKKCEKKARKKKR